MLLPVGGEYQFDLLCELLVGKIQHIGHVLGGGIEDIVQVVCVIVLGCTYVLNVLRVSYLLVI